MKALITGAEGFIGSHIADFLVNKGIDVFATVHKEETRNLKHLNGKITILKMDIAQKESVERVLSDVSPDYVFHMGAQSFVIPSWQNIEKTFDTNIYGTLKILESVRKIESDPIIVLACSSASYGLTKEDEIPIKETKEFRPSSPYAISKATTDMLGYLYWRTYDMKIIRSRFFNTIGPRKTGSAVADWGKGIAEIEAGIKDELGVGNLEPIIDLTDVRDSVKAIWLLTEKGTWGEAYNVCTGEGHKMSDILDTMVKKSRSNVKVVQDSSKFRLADDPIFIGDNSKIKSLGWKPQISFDKILTDVLDYWRNEVK